MKNSLSKAERTRQFIVETTADLFNAKGYAGTSVSDLTQATGLTKGSIYGNFADKQAVALACFDYNLNRLHGLIESRLAQSLSFEAKLLVYVQVYQEFLADSFPRGGCPILNTAIDADDTNAALKDRAAQAILSWQERLMGLIRGGIAVGELRVDAPVAQTALSMIALIEGGIMIARVTNDPTSLAHIMNTLKLLISQLRP